MSQLAIGMLIGLAVAGFLISVGVFVAMALQIRRTASRVEEFLGRAQVQLDQVVTDVHELKGKVEPLTEPLQEGLESLASTAKGLDSLGQSVRRAADQLPGQAAQLGSRIGTFVPIAVSLGSALAGLIKKRSKKGD